jgi:hypothetical protein
MIVKVPFSRRCVPNGLAHLLVALPSADNYACFAASSRKLRTKEITDRVLRAGFILATLKFENNVTYDAIPSSSMKSV